MCKINSSHAISSFAVILKLFTFDVSFIFAIIDGLFL